MRSKLRLEIASEQEGEDFVSKQECIKTGVEKFDDGALSSTDISKPS